MKLNAWLSNSVLIGYWQILCRILQGGVGFRQPAFYYLVVFQSFLQMLNTSLNYLSLTAKFSKIYLVHVKRFKPKKGISK